jgi:hypothetical protein
VSDPSGAPKLQHAEQRMAKMKIAKKDGTPTPYFWSDRDGSDLQSKRVYKQTSDGVKRMTGVSFNAQTQRIQKD